MSLRFSILVASILAVTSTNALGGDVPPKEPFKGWIGPPPLKEDKDSHECPPKTPDGSTKLVYCVQTQEARLKHDQEEARRKLAGVGKTTWYKMTDAEKDEAVEKAKAARSKAGSPSNGN